MSLEKSNSTLLLVEWKHLFPSPSKQFDKFDKLIIQGSLKWMTEWKKVQEECLKEIEECLVCEEWICSSWKWWNNYHQNILLILDNSLFDLYCKTIKILIFSACLILTLSWRKPLSYRAVETKIVSILSLTQFFMTCRGCLSGCFHNLDALHGCCQVFLDQLNWALKKI